MPNSLLSLYLILAIFSILHAQLPYQISPSVPPVAFLGQPYSCQFIVPGLTSPNLVYRDLPSFLTVDKTGTLVGIPPAIGAYPFTVVFGSGRSSWKQDVVLRVLEPSLDGVPQLISTLPNRSFGGRCTYRVGQQIMIDLSGVVDGPSVTWSYVHMPNDLVGNRQGLIRGHFLNDGYYSFGALCTDQYGSVLDYFFTLNVQANSYGTLMSAVPRRNILRYDIRDLVSIQEQAMNNLKDAFNLVANLKLEVARLAVVVEANLQDLGIADKQADSVQKLVKVVVSKRIKISHLVNRAQNQLSWARGHFELHKTAFEQAKEITEAAQKQLRQARATIQKIKDVLDRANEDYTSAKTGVISGTVGLKTAQILITDAQKDITRTFKEIVHAKKALQEATYQLKKANLEADNAHIAKDQAELQNDHATSSLHKADKNVQRALSNLKEADSEVNYLRGRAKNAAEKMGIAQFNLKQATNRLIVAQSAKQQSDKAIAILSAQESSLSILEGKSTYIVNSCEPGPYPMIAGSAQVVAASTNGYQLDSGYTVVFGECSARVDCKVGDMITFDGYLKDGFIHGIDISKA